MTDRYASLAELERNEREGTDFLRVVRPSGTGWVVLAPHGGGIEPGTSEIARAVAGECLALYLFEGISRSGNARLHVGSARFDDPRALALLERTPHALSIHGSGGIHPEVAVGGLDVRTGDAVITALRSCGVAAARGDGTRFPGTDPLNICNRCASGAGVQLEFSHGLRLLMFRALSRSGRRHPTDLFVRITAAVRAALPGDLGSSA